SPTASTSRSSTSTSRTVSSRRSSLPPARRRHLRRLGSRRRRSQLRESPGDEAGGLMAALAAAERSTDAPPDVRGPTSPFPASVFVLGVAALSLVLGGTIALQIGWAISGASLTP